MPELIYRRAKAVHDFRNSLRFVSPASTHPTENKVQIPYQPYLNFGAGDFALSLWAYPVLRAAAAPTGSDINRFAIMSHLQTGTGSAPSTLAVLLAATGGNDTTPATTVNSMVLQLRNRLAGSNTQVTRILQPASLPNMAGTWNQLVFQRAGTALQVWLNGTMRAQLAITAGEYMDSFGTTILLGASEGPAGFNGYMDEFAVYNRSLTQDEITGLYNNGLGNIPPLDAIDNIVSYWRFDQHSGRILADNTALYNTLFNPGNGTLLNYTDAQVAANGQPQSGQTAWVDHFTLVPSAIDPNTTPLVVQGTPATVLDATFTAPAGTLMNNYVPEIGPQFTQASTWITGTCPPWAFDGAGNVSSSTSQYVFAAAPLNQSGIVRGVMEGMVYPVIGGKGFVLLSNAAGTDMIRYQLNRPGPVGSLQLLIVFDRAGQGSVVHFIDFTAADGGELVGETDGTTVNVRYVQGGITRAQMTRTAPSPYTGGFVGMFTGEGAQSTITRFTVTRFT